MLSPDVTPIIQQMAESPYPPSFQGSGWAFGLSLFSLMLIAAIGTGTVSVAGRNLWRRKMWRMLWWKHLAFLLAAIGASTRCGIEAAYMMAWGETSIATLESLMFAKRVVDSLVVIPVIAWMSIYTLKISLLDRHRYRKVRYGLAVGLVAAVAAIFALNKV